MLPLKRASLMAQTVKNMSAMRETWGSIPGWGVQYLGQEFGPRVGNGSGRSPGERNGSPHSSILAWRISWTEEPWQATQSMGSQRVAYPQNSFNMKLTNLSVG